MRDWHPLMREGGAQVWGDSELVRVFLQARNPCFLRLLECNTQGLPLDGQRQIKPRQPKRIGCLFLKWHGINAVYESVRNTCFTQDVCDRYGIINVPAYGNLRFGGGYA